MKAILSVSEAAKELGIGRTKTYELIASGRLRAVKLDRRTMILYRDIEDFLASLPPWGG
jgi:excisionase family DNA binding protein